MQEETMRKGPSGVIGKHSCHVLDSRSKEPHFTMREYVLAVRQVDLKKTWPFSQKHLRLWLDRGKEPLLPPLDHPPPTTLFSSQVQLDCQPSECEIISKEEESFDSKATVLQVRSKEGSTVLEPEPDIKLVKTGNLPEKQLIGIFTENGCHGFKTRGIRDSTGKHSKSHKQLDHKRNQASKAKAGKRFFKSKIQRAVNELNHKLLKVKGASEGRISSTSVDSSKEDAIVDLVSKAGIDWQEQDLSPKGSNKVGKHPLFIANSGNMCSRNAKLEEFNVDVQSQESTTSLVTNQILNLLKENEETQGKIKIHEGETSQAECRLSTPGGSQMRFDVEAEKCMSPSMKELITTSEEKVKHKKKGLDISRKEFAMQEEDKEKASRHEVTRAITLLMEESPSTETGDTEVGRKCVEVNSVSILSDPLISKLCPVCRKFVSTSNTALNAHIDHCLTVGAPLGNSIRLQNCRPKQKIRSIADICAKVPASMLDQKVTKNWSSSLSSCGFDLKDRRIQQKHQISTLKTCELRRKLDFVKKTSKRKCTVSDSEDMREYKRNTKRRKPRSSIGIKRKNQPVPDSENHLSWETAKSTITSISNSPSKVQNSEAHQHTAPSLDIQYPGCEHIKVAQSPSIPQVSRFTKKHRACFRRRKKNLSESHMALNHSGGDDKGLNMMDDFCQPVYILSNNKETYLPPAYKGSCITIKTSCALSKNDGLRMAGQLLSGDEASAIKTTHTITNNDERVVPGQDFKKEKAVPPISTEKPISQSQSTGKNLVRWGACSDEFSDAADVQNSGIIDVHEGHLLGGIVDSNTSEMVKSVESTCLYLKETKKSNLSTECLPTDFNCKTEHLILKDFMTGGSERVEEDENGRRSPGLVTTQETLQKSFQCESELLIASNGGIYGTNEHDWQSSKKEMNQHLGNTGTLRSEKITIQPEPLRPTEIITSITKPFENRSCSRSDILHFEENNMLVSAGLTMDMNADHPILKAETSLTGIKATSEQITLQKFSAHFVDSIHLDCPKISAQTASSTGTRNIKDLSFQKLTGSSITTNQLMSEGKLSSEFFLSEVFENHSAASVENKLKNQGCESIGEEPAKITRSLLAEHHQDLTSLRMGLPSLSCMDFHCKTGNQLGSTPSKPCSTGQDTYSTALPGIAASVNTINFAPGVTSRAGSWTAAVKMASRGTQLWDMPGGSFLQLDSSISDGSISEPQPQNPGICSRTVSVVQKEDIASTLGNYSVSDSLCTPTISSVSNNAHYINQRLVKQGNSMEATCHSPQEPVNMEKSWTSKIHLRDEENCIQRNGNFGFNSTGIFSKSGNAAPKTSTPRCIQSSDISPGLHIENCTIREVNQLISNDQRDNCFKVPMSPSSERQKHLPAQSSATASDLFEHTGQPAVIYIFGKPISVLATEHEEIAHHANNQFEMIKHRESAREMIAPLPDITKESLPAARITSATMNMNFDKHLNEGSDICQNIREIFTLDDVPLSELLSAKVATDTFHKEKSQSRKLELSPDGNFLILGNCIQNPTGEGSLCAGNCQTQTLSKAVQLKGCGVRLGTQNLLSSPNIDYMKYDSSDFTCHTGESHFHSVKHPEVASYCSAQATSLHESKAIPMGVNTHSGRIGNRTTKASSIIASRLISDGRARKTVINASKSSTQSNVIVIDDDDDEDALNLINTPIDQVPEFSLGVVCPAKISCKVLKSKKTPSSCGTLAHVQSARSRLLVPGSNLETQGRAWKKGQNCPATIPDTQLCDTEDQLQFDAPALSSIWMQQNIGSNGPKIWDCIGNS